MTAFSGFNNWLSGLYGDMPTGGGHRAGAGFFPGGGSPSHSPTAGGWEQTQGYPGGSTWQAPPTSPNAQRVSSPFGGPSGGRVQYFAPPGSQGPTGPTYGDLLAGAVLQGDMPNAEAARQQELAMLQGLFDQSQGMRQGIGQMVGDAQQMGQQGMNLMFNQAANITGASRLGDQVTQQARADVDRSLGEARRGMERGIGTMESAIQQHDFFRKDTVASGVMGIQQQYRNQLDAIQQRNDLTDEQKSMMTSELRQGMQQQSAAYAAENDQRAAEGLLQARNALSQMQFGAGQTMGGLGLQGAQLVGGLGAQSAANQLQAQQAIGQMYSAMHQFSSGLMNSAQATALQMELAGNQVGAQLVQQMPLGPVSIAEMLARAVTGMGVERGDVASDRFMGMLA